MRRSQKHLLEDKVLNIEKGVSVTSYRVVDQIKKLLAIGKAGHAGSLDPFATGVLLICTGKATKVTRFLMELEKEYLGTITLGSETETDDLTGEVVSSKQDFSVSREQLEKAVSAFVGDILQHPPRVSALKQRGKRFYHMARHGENFETEAREVTVYDFRVRAFRFPELDFLLRCSKGTYVRALARDLGRKLGCGAHLSALRRIRVGPFAIQNSMNLEKLKEIAKASESGKGSPSIVSINEALSFLPACILKEGVEEKVLHGRSPSLNEFEALDAGVAPNQNVRILSSHGAFLAIGRTPSSEAEAIVRLERVLSATHG